MINTGVSKKGILCYALFGVFYVFGRFSFGHMQHAESDFV